MLVKLKQNWNGKEKGTTPSISSDRAYILMKKNIAIEDRSFVAMYEKAHSIKKPKPKKKKGEK